MCESSRNFTTSEVNAKISELNESSQNSRLSSYRTKNTLESCDDISCQKWRRSDLIFDSGIQSESNLSSGIISESDLGVDDNERNSSTLEKLSNSADGAETDLSENESAKSIRLDSGIDIDISDRLDISSLDNDFSTEERSSVNVVRVEYYCSSRPAVRGVRVDETVKIPAQSNFELNQDGNTPLHLAVMQGDEEFVRKVLQLMPDSHYLDIRNVYRQTSLHVAILSNFPKIARLLLLAGAKTGVEDRNGNTTLHLACEKNNLECVKALLTHITVYERKYTLFQYKPVIDSPCEYINEYNHEGLSCVHLAAIHPDLRVLHLLFLNGGDVNIRECKGGYTILHTAVRNGNYSLVKYILQHSGIDVEKKNYARLTPYQLCGFHPRIANILLEKGASRLRTVDDESDDEDDYSSDDYDEDNLNAMNQVSDMICSLTTNDKTAAVVSL